MSIRVGVIGASFAKAAYLPALATIPDAEVVALASARLEHAREAARAFGVQHAYDDWQTMLRDHELDLVCIATPTVLHAPMTLAALESGADVLCEKPTAMDAREARTMLETAKRLGRRHLIGHELRFNPNRRTVHDLIRDGAIGTVRHAHIVNIGSSWADLAARRKGDWWSDAASGGGRLGANGSHQVDLLRWWLGEVSEVCGEALTVIPARVDPETSERWIATADDLAHFTLRTEAAALATVFMSGVARHELGNHTQLFGSEGTILLSNHDERLLLSRDGGSLEDVSERDPNADLPGVNAGIWNVSVVGLLKEFTDAIREERPVRSGATFEDGLQNQLVLDAVKRSHAERRWVRPSEVEADDDGSVRTGAPTT
jgi:predicted dehydrogenase